MNMISIFYFFLCGYNSIIIVFANDYCKIYHNAATFVFLPFSTDSLHTFPLLMSSFSSLLFSRFIFKTASTCYFHQSRFKKLSLPQARKPAVRKVESIDCTKNVYRINHKRFAIPAKNKNIKHD